MGANSNLTIHLGIENSISHENNSCPPTTTRTRTTNLNLQRPICVNLSSGKYRVTPLNAFISNQGVYFQSLEGEEEEEETRGERREGGAACYHR